MLSCSLYYYDDDDDDSRLALSSSGGSRRGEKEEAATSWCWCEERPGKNMKSWAPIHVNIGFVVGVLFVLLAYLVVSQRDATSGGLNVVVTSDAQRVENKQLNQGSGESEEKGSVVYDTKGNYSPTCEVDGDVRINSTALSVSLVPSSQSERREWTIQPYSRKNMPDIKMVTVTQLQDKAAAPPCTVTYSIPAVLFALGGLTGNFWHDFSDVLVPLFIASRRYDGEVQFLISNMKPWWPVAYKTILRRLSRYEAVDLDGDDDAHVRCFPHVTVGIHQHNGLSIVPEWVPGGRRLDMTDFTRFMREVYALPRPAPVSLTREEPGRLPRLLLVHRGHSRRFLNEDEVLRCSGDGGVRGSGAGPAARLDGGRARAGGELIRRAAGRARRGADERGVPAAGRRADPGGAVRQDGRDRDAGVRPAGEGDGAQVPRLHRGRGGELADRDAGAGAPGDQGPRLRPPQRLGQDDRVLPQYAERAHRRRALRAHAQASVRPPAPAVDRGRGAKILSKF
ncbi:hypothetical protein BS78_03G085200 [Paspalum vaginatum]|nr:hypothetical protein BS78_03G085200 [Paspalum vaginatum]